MEDNFDGNDLDTGIWMREADMGGFGWVCVSFCIHVLTTKQQEW